MVDYILAVDCPRAWHAENLLLNPHHYSPLLAWAGAPAVAGLADRWGVGVYFNTMVPWQDGMIKYGVIATSRLYDDLVTWSNLYVAGRLQKPVKHLVDNRGICKLNRLNVQSALAAALLLLPQHFSEEELYLAVCQLSYLGDIRMYFAEDRKKVERIVQGNPGGFRQLYGLPARHLAAVGLLDMRASVEEGGAVKWRQVRDGSPPPVDYLTDVEDLSPGNARRSLQDDSPASRISLLSSLPSSLLLCMAQRAGLAKTYQQALLIDPNAATAMAQQVMDRTRGDCRAFVKRAIGATNFRSSFRQAVVSFLAAGSSNAAKYVGRKMAKARMSRST
eukprot:SM000056S17945  [mRNA]  locus=s56:187015:190168:- [translate_table: standard]